MPSNTPTKNTQPLPPHHIPENGLWEAGIYQIEVTDQALGYNPSTGVDGPANRQWISLANRTGYLKNLYEADHTVEGAHRLTNDDFVAETQIPESKLALDHGTRELATNIVTLADNIEATREDLADGDYTGDLTLTLAMTKLIPMSWEFSGNKYAFDLFTDSMSLRYPKQFVVTKAVKEDDSIDVVSTSGLAAGEMYLLTTADGTEYQFVTIAAILSEHRVLLAQPSNLTFGHGYLRGTNVLAENFVCKADKDFVYLSDFVDSFNNAERTEIHINHSPEDSANIELAYNTGFIWFTIPRTRRDEFGDYQADVFNLPEGISRFRIRIRYTGLSKETSFHSILFISERAQEWIEDVYRPSITSAIRGLNNTLTVSGSWYGALYDIEQAGMQLQLSTYNDFASILESFDLPGIHSVMTVTPTATFPVGARIYARIRYYSVEDVYSRWSPSYALTTTTTIG